MQVTAGDAASGENARLSFVHVWALTTPDALVVLGHHLTSPHLTSPLRLWSREDTCGEAPYRGG